MAVIGTDRLRSLADDIDDRGELLTDFVLLGGVRCSEGDVVRVFSSGAGRDAAVAALRQGINLLRGGSEQ